MYAYNNRILRVNLTTGKLAYEELGDELLKLFVGGKGLGTYIVYREVDPRADPLGPGNKLVFSAGGLSGLVPGSSKVAVVAKSPLTDLLTDSYAGDYFGPMLKRAGFDAIVVEGVSDTPVYLWVKDGEAEIRDASQLWGLGVPEATRRILEETRGDASVAVIGRAGEKLVRISSIIFDLHRAAGRGGLGAVLGSKRLKAVAVHGSGEPEVYDGEALKSLSKRYYERYESEAGLSYLRRYGTTNALSYSARIGMSPGYNFSRPYLPRELAERLAGREVVRRQSSDVPAKLHGKSCPVKCGRYVVHRFRGGEYAVKPEYESLAMLGAATGVFEMDWVLHYIYLVNLYGLDAISTGNTVAWFLEAVEKGVIDPGEFGLSIKGFGDKEGVETLIRLIGEKRGVGAILSQGVRRAAEMLGRGGEFAVHVKGLEAPAWDPRGRRGMAVTYLTADIGASHLRGWPQTRDPPASGPAAAVVGSMVEDRDWNSVMDHLGICKFIPYTLEDLAELYSLATGLPADRGFFSNLSARTEALSRIFNVLSWVTPPIDDFELPRRWWEREAEGPAKGSAAFLDEGDLRGAVEAYYRIRGWDASTGVPLPETLRKLGLGWAVDDALEAAGAVRRRLGLP